MRASEAGARVTTTGLPERRRDSSASGRISARADSKRAPSPGGSGGALRPPPEVAFSAFTATGSESSAPTTSSASQNGTYVADEGVAPYPASVAFLDAVIASGCRVAVVSSSKNAPSVLAAAGIDDRFTVVVDGLVAAREGIRGKPAPDMFLEAAKRLDVGPAQAVVVEDAVSGVAAGRAGGFALVVGVDRGAGHDELLAQGADVVVDDLGDTLDEEET